MQVNHVPKLNMQTSTTGCCPKFDPKDWDDKTFVFKDKLFVRAKTRSFLFIPLNMSSVISKTWKAIEDANAKDADDEFLMLSQDVSPWHADHYFSVSIKIEGQDNQQLSGTYKTKVFEGSFKEAKNWHDAMVKIGTQAGAKTPNVYFYYTTCPKCAKVYGKNYVVGFVQTN